MIYLITGGSYSYYRIITAAEGPPGKEQEIKTLLDSLESRERSYSETIQGIEAHLDRKYGPGIFYDPLPVEVQVEYAALKAPLEPISPQQLWGPVLQKELEAIGVTPVKHMEIWADTRRELPKGLEAGS